MSTRLILRSVCVIALIVHAPADILAQGIAAINGRNHPELQWKVAETQHFRIMYPEHLEGIEESAAAIAEQSYDALSQNLGVTFDQPIRVYLSDEDEISNGFASRLGDGWTSIWVHANTIGDWTGPESWLRRVIAHEVAHLFHYRAVRSNIGLFDFLFANPLPRFWTEGLAQYQTERWDTFRGETWLRTAVLEDRLSYRDGRSVWNGRLLYAVGNSQVRFLADTQGDSTLTRILQHRRPALLGIARVHDFDRAFREVTGESYRDFHERWRRHVNIFYNTVAGQLQTVDSLDATRQKQPGHYISDVRGLPGERRLILYLESVDRPVRRLAIVDTTASSPALRPDGSKLAYSLTTGGVSRIVVVSPDSADADTLTTPSRGQISHLAWHPDGSSIAYYIFDEDGRRRLEIVDVTNGEITRLTSGEHDDRRPVWSPDGNALGYTSLRDDVPNIFVADPADGTVRRVTQLATGATLADWTAAPDSSAGLMTTIVTESKERDAIYSLNAQTSTQARTVDVAPGYASWTTHTPPSQIPAIIPPNPEVVQKRYSYNTWKNISHVASIGLPYFNSTADWGVGGGTLWIEPLGKHVLGAAAGLSVADIDKSFFAFTYINNQLRPSLALAASRFPDAGRPYGEDILREDWTSVSLAALFPLDWFPKPYTSTRLLLWAEHFDVTPLNASSFEDRADGLPVPEAGRQTRLRLSFKRKTLRPYRFNQSHPLDGWGIRSRLTLAIRETDIDQTYARIEGSAYAIVPTIERHRLYLHGRYRGQSGTSLPQDFVGLSRYDAIRVDAGELLQFTTSESDRVRGHRRLVIGSNVLFGSAEYRIPLVPSLRTEILGIVSFGSTVLAPFFDAGFVWSRPNGRAPVAQYGAGIEIKNALKLGGVIEVTQSIGFAQPASALFSDDRYEIYYRIMSALPF